MGAPEIGDAGVVPGDAVLVGIGGVVLLRHVVQEEAVRQGLVAVRVRSRDVERDRVVVADVLGERLARVAVEHDDAHHAADAREEVVLPTLVVVERADHALAREREVRLPDGLVAARTRASAP